uniref:Cytochrome P450 CYP4XH1 n=1 Tax=Chrysoperla zastrowi sillemi TaxID=482137 RepID=A0A9E8C0L3_9NEOP|nr:cytochrome P450 CYP4XH1 [Chrysoperla zastrowi sillemi]
MVLPAFCSIFFATYDWVSDSKEHSTSANYHIFPTITILILSLIVGKYIEYRWKNRRFFKLAAKFNGPDPLPFIGNAHMFSGTSEDVFKQILDHFYNYNDKGPSRFWLGNQLYVVITKPQHMKAVLTNPNALQKSYVYSFINTWLGTGLFSAPVTIWKHHRKIIMPSFNQKILDTFISIFQERSNVLAKKLECETGYFDIFPYVSRCTLDSICESALGITVNSLEDSNEKYVECATRVLDIVNTRMLKVWLHPDFIFKRTKLYRELQFHIQYLHNFTDSIIKQKRAEFKEIQESNRFSPTDQTNDEPIFKRKAFIQLLMETSDFTDEEIRNEVDTMTVAGNDTTATVNSFTLLLLAMYPDIQEKLYNEVYSIVGDSDKTIELEDLPKLKYTEMVIKESMRLFPIGPILGRDALEDIQLDENYTIPKGSGIALGIYYTHRDPEYWNEPDVFDPERFQPEELKTRDPYSYLPFSGGPRNCLGIKYAYMAMKILIATVIRHYKLSTDLKLDDLILKTELTLKLSNAFLLRIQKRQTMSQ